MAVFMVATLSHVLTQAHARVTPDIEARKIVLKSPPRLKSSTGENNEVRCSAHLLGSHRTNCGAIVAGAVASLSDAGGNLEPRQHPRARDSA
jgi:hypothetical protein